MLPMKKFAARQVAARKAAGVTRKDVTAIPRADHKLVGGLFAENHKTRSTAQKAKPVAPGAAIASRKPELMAVRP